MARARVREIREEAGPRENGAPADYKPRLKVLYEQELRARLKDELGASTVMDVPRLQKITLNMGVGEAKTDAKQLDAAIEELTTIAGQRAQVLLVQDLEARFVVADRRAVLAWAGLLADLSDS